MRSIKLKVTSLLLAASLFTSLTNIVFADDPTAPAGKLVNGRYDPSSNYFSGRTNTVWVRYERSADGWGACIAQSKENLFSASSKARVFVSAVIENSDRQILPAFFDSLRTWRTEKFPATTIYQAVFAGTPPIVKNYNTTSQPEVVNDPAKAKYLYSFGDSFRWEHYLAEMKNVWASRDSLLESKYRTQDWGELDRQALAAGPWFMAFTKSEQPDFNQALSRYEFVLPLSPRQLEIARQAALRNDGGIRCRVDIEYEAPAFDIGDAPQPLVNNDDLTTSARQSIAHQAWNALYEYHYALAGEGLSKDVYGNPLDPRLFKSVTLSSLINCDCPERVMQYQLDYNKKSAFGYLKSAADLLNVTDENGVLMKAADQPEFIVNFNSHLYTHNRPVYWSTNTGHTTQDGRLVSESDSLRLERDEDVQDWAALSDKWFKMPMVFRKFNRARDFDLWSNHSGVAGGFGFEPTKLEITSGNPIGDMDAKAMRTDRGIRSVRTVQSYDPKELYYARSSVAYKNGVYAGVADTQLSQCYQDANFLRLGEGQVRFSSNGQTKLSQVNADERLYPLRGITRVPAFGKVEASLNAFEMWYRTAQIGKAYEQVREELKSNATRLRMVRNWQTKRYIPFVDVEVTTKLKKYQISSDRKDLPSGFMNLNQEEMSDPSAMITSEALDAAMAIYQGRVQRQIIADHVGAIASGVDVGENFEDMYAFFSGDTERYGEFAKKWSKLWSVACGLKAEDYDTPELKCNFFPFEFYSPTLPKDDADALQNKSAYEQKNEEERKDASYKAFKKAQLRLLSGLVDLSDRYKVLETQMLGWRPWIRDFVDVEMKKSPFTDPRTLLYTAPNMPSEQTFANGLKVSMEAYFTNELEGLIAKKDDLFKLDDHLSCPTLSTGATMTDRAKDLIATLTPWDKVPVDVETKVSAQDERNKNEFGIVPVEQRSKNERILHNYVLGLIDDRTQLQYSNTQQDKVIQATATSALVSFAMPAVGAGATVSAIKTLASLARLSKSASQVAPVRGSIGWVLSRFSPTTRQGLAQLKASSPEFFMNTMRKAALIGDLEQASALTRSIYAVYSKDCDDYLINEVVNPIGFQDTFSNRFDVQGGNRVSDGIKQGKSKSDESLKNYWSCINAVAWKINSETFNALSGVFLSRLGRRLSRPGDFAVVEHAELNNKPASMTRMNPKPDLETMANQAMAIRSLKPNGNFGNFLEMMVENWNELFPVDKALLILPGLEATLRKLRIEYKLATRELEGTGTIKTLILTPSEATRLNRMVLKLYKRTGVAMEIALNDPNLDRALAYFNTAEGVVLLNPALFNSGLYNVFRRTFVVMHEIRHVLFKQYLPRGYSTVFNAQIKVQSPSGELRFAPPGYRKNGFSLEEIFDFSGDMKRAADILRGTPFGKTGVIPSKLILEKKQFLIETLKTIHAHGASIAAFAKELKAVNKEISECLSGKNKLCSVDTLSYSQLGPGKKHLCYIINILDSNSDAIRSYRMEFGGQKFQLYKESRNIPENAKALDAAFTKRLKQMEALANDLEAVLADSPISNPLSTDVEKGIISLDPSAGSYLPELFRKSDEIMGTLNRHLESSLIDGEFFRNPDVPEVPIYLP